MKINNLTQILDVASVNTHRWIGGSHIMVTWLHEVVVDGVMGCGVYERERERERERDTHTHTQTEREREKKERAG